MKKYILIIIGLFMICSQVAIGKIQNQESNEKHQNLNKKKSSLNSTTDYGPIIIHYGLNDSHSRSWVQENGQGIVGITYFQRFQGSATEGTLIYKTIHPDGSENTDSITVGTRLEKSVLLYDSLSSPHIFVASSDTIDQIIDHYYKNNNNQWQSDTIIHFYNEGGKFIYELSADTGPDGSFHLLILKTRSDIDSDDYNWAWLDSYLYHMTNVSGSWVKELVQNYDMGYTYDTYVKTSCRQDIKVDNNGFVHVIFREQIFANDDPSRLWYATNNGGNWTFELALDNTYGIRDDAGWFPSLCLDNNGIPYISCMYVKRVYTYSASWCKLFLLKRLGSNNWQTQIIVDSDDGYYGGDGRNYTGGLTHLVFDKNSIPHIIFSDIASTHWPAPQNQSLNIGNIRYGVLENGTWNIQTIYRQPLPTGFFNATEMHGMCLIVSENTDTIRVIGEEMVITGVNQYSSTLLHFAWDNINIIKDEPFIKEFELYQNYPNPFNPKTTIKYNLEKKTNVILKMYNIHGQEVKTLVNKLQTSGGKSITWDGTDNFGRKVSSGVYVYRIQSEADDWPGKSKKLLILK